MTDTTTTTPDIVAELVGDGKKFKTIADLAASVKEKDAFIPRLQDENRELRSLLKTVESQDARLTTMADILNKVNSNLGKVGDPPPGQGTTTTTSTGTPNQTTGLTRDDVKKLFDEVEAEKRSEHNKGFANKKLNEAYGDKAHEVLIEKSAQLGVTVEQMQDLAKRSPNAFLSMLGIPDKTNKQTTPMGNTTAPRSSVNTDVSGLDGQANGVRNKAYYDKLKTEMGNTKFIMNQKVQIQLHKDMRALGEEFFK